MEMFKHTQKFSDRYNKSTYYPADVTFYVRAFHSSQSSYFVLGLYAPPSGYKDYSTVLLQRFSEVQF